MKARLDRDTLHGVLASANLAPSVHNSQPWRWSVGPGSVALHADLHRWLSASDALGRDLVLSCGAALHHLQVAAGAAGLGTVIHRLPDPDNPDHLATVDLHPGVEPVDMALATAIPVRRSDRRPFVARPVPAPMLKDLDAAVTEHGALVRVLPESAHAAVLSLVAEAAAAQEATPGYVEELLRWSGRHGAPVGVPAANTLRSDGEAEVVAGRQFVDGELRPTHLGPDGATLLVLGTSGDGTLARLQAGEALSALLLEATRVRLATCVLTQPLQVEPTWARLRDDVVGGGLCPQVLLRLGWVRAAEHLPATPRLPLADTLTEIPPLTDQQGARS